MEVTVGGQLEGSDSRDRRSMRLVEYLVCILLIRARVMELSGQS